MFPVYIHVDETGQQTGGDFLVVAGIVVGTDRAKIEADLCKIEASSKKRIVDWHGTSPDRLYDYLKLALCLPSIHKTVFFRAWKNHHGTKYTDCSITSTLAMARLHKDRAPVVFVPEGLPRLGRQQLLRAARRSRFNDPQVWNGELRKHALVRLADSVAGLVAVRRFEEGHEKDFPDLHFDWFREMKA